jgi:hypothetical protein
MSGAGGFEPLPRFLEIALGIPEADHQGHFPRLAADASADGASRGNGIRR